MSNQAHKTSELYNGCVCILAKCRISVLAILLLLVLHYSQTGCSLAGLTVKPDVLLRATLQYCDAMLQYWLASCLEQIAIALTSCRSTVTVVFNVYCKIKGKFVPQACNMCIFKHFKLILNVFLPVRRLERELVYNYTSNLYEIPSKN